MVLKYYTMLLILFMIIPQVDLDLFYDDNTGSFYVFGSFIEMLAFKIYR